MRAEMTVAALASKAPSWWRHTARARLVVVVLAALGVLVGCSDDTGAECGKGTHLVKGACVPLEAIDACGPGTILDGTTCYAAEADGNAGDGTTADSSEADSAGDTADDTAAGGDDTTDAADTSPVPCDPACAPGFACVAGACQVVPMPTAWSCAPVAYDDGATCDCGCGAPDPDCADAKLPVDGCVGVTSCNPDGSCPACTPACTGKECGDDGCGGICGACLDVAKPSCIAGICSACVPDCSGKSCGDDGCGGSCGTCAIGKLCQQGTCDDPPAEASCFGNCGGVAASGCACTIDCAAQGNCCANVNICGCLPKCTGKACGDDGCGGSCGSCVAGTFCSEGQCEKATCNDGTCNGHGKCDPATVTCTCEGPYAGELCDSCKLGYVGYPSCVTACTDDAACDDGNPCSGDSCSPTLGCVHVPLAVACDDGDACTSGDACADNACKPGAATDCSDGNACTDDACDAAKGCSHTANGAQSCDDGDACTVNGGCEGTSCKVTGATSCDDANVCTDDSCVAPTGCVHLPNGATCADNDKCSAGSACQGSTCASLGAVNCDDGNSCTVDSCLAATGACAHAKAAAGSVCDDGNPCSGDDSCAADGTCQAGAAICALEVKSGLLAHYSAAFAASMDFAEDGGVTVWRDLSGNARHLKVVDDAKRPKRKPARVHGRPGVAMASSAGLRSPAFARAAAATVVAVVCTEGNAAIGAIAAHGDAAAGWALAQLPGAATTVHAVSAGADGGASLALANDTCVVVSARASSAARALSVTATLTQDAAGAGGALTAGDAILHVGTDATNATSSVVVAELLVFDRALTDAERDSVANYLRIAWAFPVPQPDFAWYDAADLPTVVTASDASGLVQTWKDKSGSGKDAQLGSNKAPSWLAKATSNGRPAIRFDGPQVRLQTAEHPTSPQMTVFAVFEMDKPQAWGAVFAQGHDSYFSLRKTEKVSGNLCWQIVKQDTKPVLPLQLGKWQLWTATQSATTSTLHTDPTKPATAAQGPIPAGKASLSLGNAGLGGNESMGGWLAEIRAYGSVLHPSDRAFVEQLLRTRYGL